MLNGFEVTIGQRVLKLRREKKISQTALAKAAGLSRKAVNKVESGQNRRMEVRTVILLAGVLEVTPNDLIIPGHEALSNRLAPAPGGQTTGPQPRTQPVPGMRALGAKKKGPGS